MSRKIYLKEWRKHRGLTQAQLAELVETTDATISRIETGKFNYTRATLEKLADALNCSPADILERDPADPGYKIISEITKLKPELKAQALRIIRAMAEEAA